MLAGALGLSDLFPENCCKRKKELMVRTILQRTSPIIEHDNKLRDGKQPSSHNTLSIDLLFIKISLLVAIVMNWLFCQFR